MLKRLLSITIFFISICHTHAQEIIADSNFFTPEIFFQEMGLVKTESNKALRVYTKNEDNPDDVSRIVDIRWVFATKKEASDYLDKNLELQSEGGYRMKKEVILPNAEKLYIYREEPASVSMYEMMGAENVHWYYLFIIDRVVAKVFTSGNKTSIATSYKFALEAAKHISSKLNLPVKEADVSKFNFPVGKGFKEKLENGRLDFFPIPGFEPNTLPESLTNYFDQEFIFPGEKYCVRYFIIQNPEEVKGSLEDTATYKEYRKSKKGASLSVSLNIMMPDRMGALPNSKENQDWQSCKKINNSDFIIESYFEIGKNSELGKGYKYCYMYASYKQGAPDCYVVFLSDDIKKIGLFRQLNKSSIKYND